MESLYSLSLSGTAVKELPSSIEKLVGLYSLTLDMCVNLQFLPNLKIHSLDLRSIPELPYMCVLDARGCTSLESVSSSRIEVVKKVWAYIRENNLQDRKNIRNILCDVSFRSLFNVDSIDMFQMNKALSNHIWLRYALMNCFSLTRGEYIHQVLFLNCFKLDQNVRNNIIADVQLRFSSMVANAALLESHVDYNACICYPGSEIPEWFIDHQTTGSSINIKHPGIWRIYKCLGFSICFVAECNEYTYASRAFRCEFHLRAKYGESLKLETTLWRSSENGVEGTQILNSDHVFLCYKNPYSWALACKEAEDGKITEMSFHIYPFDLCTESFIHGDSCKVKKCGIRLLSPQDAKEFGLATNPGYWNSYKEDDDATSNCTESSDEEPIGRELDGSVAESEDHQTYSKSEIIDVEDSESKEEENGDISGFNKSVPSRIIACGSAIEQENVLSKSEIVLESSVTKEEEEEEEDKQSQRGTIEKGEEDPQSVSHGCLLFLSVFKGIKGWQLVVGMKRLKGLIAKY